MLTPYEIGRETGRLQAQVHPEISNERAEHLAHILGIEERLAFMEGYRNGFTETQAALVPNPSWALSPEEVDEAERQIADLAEGNAAYVEMVEDETKALNTFYSGVES